MTTYILGLNSYHGDSAACILQDRLILQQRKRLIE